MTPARLKGTVISGGMAVVCVLSAGAWVHARQAAPPLAANEDVLPALLTEVRGLRAAMEQMASAGPRVQLFASRLQMQETRVNNLSKRLSDVRDTLAASQQGLAGMQGQQQQLEAAMAEQRAGGTPEARAEAQQAEAMLVEVKRSALFARTTVDRLIAEEAQLTAEIATEQGRWTEINSRLDDLEKMLARR